MAMADQGADEIEDFFIRVTLGSVLTNRFETQEIQSDSHVVEEDDEAEAEAEPDEHPQTPRGVISVHNKVFEEN
jgi:hypothetical protein